MKILNLGICFFFSILFEIAAAQSAFLKIQQPNVESLEKRFGFFIFGDSYVDAGNNNYINGTIDLRSNIRPYGESFFPIPTGRFTDGRIVPDFLAEYAGIPFIQPYLDPNNNDYMNGVNFASGGATIIAGLNKHKEVLGLQTQVEFFKEVVKSLRKKMGNERTQTFLSNSVFLFNFGGNDYTIPCETSCHIFDTIESQEQYVSMVVGNMTITLKEVYNYGGRKFGFMGLPPTGYLPNSRTRNDHKYIQNTNSLARIHNNQFFIALQRLAKQLNGFKYAFADAHTFFLQRIQNPTKYGFKVVDTACCGSEEFRGYYNCGRNIGATPYTHCKNIKDYLFYDSYHPTGKAYKQISKLIWSGGAEIVKPYNFMQLFQYDLTLASN